MYFKCKSSNCKAKIVLNCKLDNNFSICISNDEHQHLSKVIRGIADEIKRQIDQLFDDDFQKSKHIIKKLIDHGMQPPTNAQITNNLTKLRPKKLGHNCNL